MPDSRFPLARDNAFYAAQQGQQQGPPRSERRNGTSRFAGSRDRAFAMARSGAQQGEPLSARRQPAGSTVIGAARQQQEQQQTPQVSRPQAARPQAARPQAARPQVAPPQAARPQAARSQVARPQVAGPQATRPQTNASAVLAAAQAVGTPIAPGARDLADASAVVARMQQAALQPAAVQPAIDPAIAFGDNTPGIKELLNTGRGNHYNLGPGFAAAAQSPFTEDQARQLYTTNVDLEPGVKAALQRPVAFNDTTTGGTTTGGTTTGGTATGDTATGGTATGGTATGGTATGGLPQNPDDWNALRRRAFLDSKDSLSGTKAVRQVLAAQIEQAGGDLQGYAATTKQMRPMSVQQLESYLQQVRNGTTTGGTATGGATTGGATTGGTTTGGTTTGGNTTSVNFDPAALSTPALTPQDFKNAPTGAINGMRYTAPAYSAPTAANSNLPVDFKSNLNGANFDQFLRDRTRQSAVGSPAVDNTTAAPYQVSTPPTAAERGAPDPNVLSAAAGAGISAPLPEGMRNVYAAQNANALFGGGKRGNTVSLPSLTDEELQAMAATRTTFTATPSAFRLF